MSKQNSANSSIVAANIHQQRDRVIGREGKEGIYNESKNLWQQATSNKQQRSWLLLRGNSKER